MPLLAVVKAACWRKPSELAVQLDVGEFIHRLQRKIYSSVFIYLALLVLLVDVSSSIVAVCGSILICETNISSESIKTHLRHRTL